jgi:hypothetical protein
VSKIQIDASRTNLRVTAEGAVAMLIGLAIIAAVLMAGLYIMVR